MKKYSKWYNENCNSKHWLSTEQKNVYFFNRLSFQNQFLSDPIVFRLKGKINLDFLESALNLAIIYYPSLQKYFHASEDKNIYKYKQVIKGYYILPLEKVSVSNQKKANEDIILGEYIEQEFLTPFELEKNLPIRAKIITLSDTEYVFLINIHPIILDKIQTQNILNKVSFIYNSLISKKDYEYQAYEYEKTCDSVEVSTSHDIIGTEYDYYIRSFKNLEWSEIPADFLKPDKLSYIGKSIKYKIPKRLFIRISELSKEYNFDLCSFFLTAFQLLIYLYTESSKSTLTFVRIEVFDYSNLNLLISSLIEGKKKILEVVKQTEDHINKVKEKRDILFEDLFCKLFPKIGNDYISYPKIEFDFKKSKSLNLDLNKIKSIKIEPPNILIGNELTVIAKMDPNSTELDFQYSIDLFRRETVQGLIKNFTTLLENISIDISKTVSEYNLLNKDELLKLQSFNTTNLAYPNKTLTQLFEEQVRKTPYNIAVIFKDKKVSYQELNNKVNKIAYYLRDNGLKLKDSIAIYLDTSLEVLTCILAILKTGASYVFIEPNYPLERVLYIINHSKSKAIITNFDLKKKLSSFYKSIKKDYNNTKEGFNIDILAVEYINIASEKYPDSNLTNINSPEDLAYIIFTSGSTGVPKAVMVQHDSVVNCVFAVKKIIDLKGSDVGLSLSSLSFDISVIGYFLPWLSGAAVLMIREGERKNSELIVNLIKEHNVTFMQATPTTWQMLINYDWIGKKDVIAIAAGEAISGELVTEIVSRVYKLYNGYGPTEATIYTTMGELKSGVDVTIGKPLSNYKVYITDKFLNSMPIGVCGELCISGVGVARGYLDDISINNDKFINNPFSISSEEDQKKFSKLYRTGDKARYLSNGEIEYLGRIDEQVKIRGYRVDPLEIEVNLMKNDLLKECAIIIKSGLNYQKLLIAFVVPKILDDLSNKQVIHRELICFLEAKLPEYMIPSNFIFIDHLPTTLSGKIDRNKLKTFPLTRPELLIPYSPARTKTEKLVHSVWKEVFQIETVGVDDNFFDLGGYSLLVTQIYNLLKKNGLKISIADMFQNPTIRLFSEYVDGLN